MEIRIEKVASQGNFIGYREDGKVIFVPYTDIGEKVSVLTVIEKKDYINGLVEKIIEPSSDRIIPKCRYFTQCGGCSFQHIPYEKEISYKKELLKGHFDKIAGIDPGDFKFIGSPIRFNYRNSARIHIRKRDGKFFTGFREKNSRRIIEVDYCYLLENFLNDRIRELNILFNNPDGHQWTKLYQLVLRCGINSDSDPVVTTSQEKGFILIEVGNMKFHTSGNSFFQVNRFILQEWLDYIGNFVSEGDLIVDLYSGSGLISMGINKEITVYAIENNREAVEAAKLNIKLNNIKDYNIYLKSVEDFCEEKLSPDAVIVDPPRSGIRDREMDNIIKMSPDRIIYSSCGPATFCRDIAQLIERGYKLTDLRAFDFFPLTFHYEVVGILEKY